MRRALKVHGFRSSLSDHAAESTHFPARVVEMALAHTIGSAVVWRALNRGFRCGSATRWECGILRVRPCPG